MKTIDQYFQPQVPQLTPQTPPVTANPSTSTSNQITFATWNTNSISSSKYTIHEIINTYDIDVIALQETLSMSLPTSRTHTLIRPSNASKFQRDKNHQRGIITLAKNNTFPTRVEELSSDHSPEIICTKLYYNNAVIHFFNIYNRPNCNKAINLVKNYITTSSDITHWVIAGDFNAKSPILFNHNSTVNKAGKALDDLLAATGKNCS